MRKLAQYLFQFTRSSRSATRFASRYDVPALFQFTRSSRSATAPLTVVVIASSVSIHALLAERDTAGIFASRSATSFNSRAPRGARQAARVGDRQRPFVSIHALLAERDEGVDQNSGREAVSIHALLAERDSGRRSQSSRRRRFNSRAPRGARHGIGRIIVNRRTFQFTRSSRSATVISGKTFIDAAQFQFTRSSRSATCEPAPFPPKDFCFNSRAPRGARHGFSLARRASSCFNSRAPRGARPADSSRSRQS